MFVREFPEGGGKWQGSTDGGIQPRWSRDGNELFYVTTTDRLPWLVAVDVTTDSGLDIGDAKLLFSAHELANRTWMYDVAADGRFVMVEDIVEEGGERPKPTIRVIQNWYEEFRDRE